MLSRRPFFARETRTRPFKSRRTFNELNRAAVRILVSGVPPNSTPASPLTAQSARSPHRHPYPRSQRSSPEPPAALHSALKPERSAIGAVIRPRFTLPALSPAQRHHFTKHHQLSTTTPHLSLIQTKDPAHSRTNHPQNSPDHTKTRTLRTQHVNLGPFSPEHPLPSPNSRSFFVRATHTQIRTTPLLRQLIVRLSCNKHSCGKHQNTNDETQQGSSVRVIPSCTSSRQARYL